MNIHSINNQSQITTSLFHRIVANKSTYHTDIHNKANQIYFNGVSINFYTKTETNLHQAHISYRVAQIIRYNFQVFQILIKYFVIIGLSSQEEILLCSHFKI